ncbi:MAG: ribosome-binding factor [Chloroflexota bacterium]|jgi:ribosome-binding factor A|nr:ribosome-binding factor [Chloroflexota bacterium]
MPTHRVDKVAAQLQVEISGILAELRDPRVGLISVVSVDLSPDLRNARVHVSTLGGDDDHRALMDVLEHAQGFVRHELAARLRSLRRIPSVRFVDDRNIEYAVRIEQVLDGLHLHDNDPANPAEDGDGG